jgi:hypothetical protein
VVLVEHQTYGDSALLGAVERRKHCGRRTGVEPQVVDRDLEAFGRAIKE